MSTKPEPVSRCHRYVYVLPGPVHVPAVALSVVARKAAPVTVGRPALAGGAVCTVAVAALARLLEPSGFVAVTSTRSVAPTSAVVSSSDALVAPPRFDQVVPS